LEEILINMLFERKLSENELEQREVVLQGLLNNKRNLVKKYGKDAEKVMYGIATKKAKSKVESMNKEKLKELITKALTKEAQPIPTSPGKIEIGDDGEPHVAIASNAKRKMAMRSVLDILKDEMGVSTDDAFDYIKTHKEDLFDGSVDAFDKDEVVNDYKEYLSVNEDNDPSGEYLEGDPDEKVEESSDVVADRDWDWTGDIDNIIDKISNAPKSIKQKIQKILSEENAYKDLDTALDHRAELGDIEKRIGNLYREMENDPDVEAEGGPVADQYGDELNRLERRQYVLKRWLKWYDEDGGVDQIHPPSMLSEDKQDAIQELKFIIDELESKAEEAREIIRANFPNELSRADAYGVFDVAYSGNRYDITLGRIVDELEEDGDYEIDENEKLPISRKKLAKAPKASKLASKQKMKLPSGLISYMDFAEMIKEKLTKKHKIGDYVEDFEKSDAKQFKGKSDKKKKQMAVAAYLSKQND
jgi:hypothetical protein